MLNILFNITVKVMFIKKKITSRHNFSLPVHQVKVLLRPCYTCDRSAEWERISGLRAGSPEAWQSLLYGSPERYDEVRWWTPWRFFPETPAGLLGLTPRHGYSGVYVPGMCHVVTGFIFIIFNCL